jgi:hypothetical protein
MSRTKVLLTVITYPLPSRSYDELVCTAGMLEDGSWIRIYPVPLNFLRGLRKDGMTKSFKYTWIELELSKREDDFRPESHSPVNYDFSDITVGDRIDTRSNWFQRKEICLNNVWTDLAALIESSKNPTNTSLAVFKPHRITKLEWKETDREWKDTWKDLRLQGSLFDDINPEITIDKLPYTFYYHFEDENGKSSRMMIEDWEIGQLYWNCLRIANGDEEKALEKVKEKYFNTFTTKNDIHLFLGTTKEYHRRRMSNPFVIIGVFYPKIEDQMSLF